VGSFVCSNLIARPDDDTEALVARYIYTFMPPRPAAEDKAAPKGRGGKV